MRVGHGEEFRGDGAEVLAAALGVPIGRMRESGLGGQVPAPGLDIETQGLPIWNRVQDLPSMHVRAASISRPLRVDLSVKGAGEELGRAPGVAIGVLAPGFISARKALVVLQR